MGCVEGRRDDNKWQDYSLFGHQLVAHWVGKDYRCPDFYNPVDGDEVKQFCFNLPLCSLTVGCGFYLGPGAALWSMSITLTVE